MPTDLELLKTARTNAIKRLVELDSGLKPTQSDPEGSIDYNGYRNSLTEEIDRLNKLILAAEPYQIVSYGRS